MIEIIVWLTLLFFVVKYRSTAGSPKMWRRAIFLSSGWAALLATGFMVSFTVGSLLLALGPVTRLAPFAWSAWADQDISSLSPLSWLLGTFNGALWLLLGLAEQDFVTWFHGLLIFAASASIFAAIRFRKSAHQIQAA